MYCIAGCKFRVYHMTAWPLNCIPELLSTPKSASTFDCCLGVNLLSCYVYLQASIDQLLNLTFCAHELVLPRPRLKPYSLYVVNIWVIRYVLITGYIISIFCVYSTLFSKLLRIQLQSFLLDQTRREDPGKKTVGCMHSGRVVDALCYKDEQRSLLRKATRELKGT